jgi:UDP-N-acetyl-D-galactosamine dehydrogenase
MILNKKIAIVGLGYVGLPLAIEFGKKYSTIGFDTVSYTHLRAHETG